MTRKNSEIAESSASSLLFEDDQSFHSDHGVRAADDQLNPIKSKKIVTTRNYSNKKYF